MKLKLERKAMNGLGYQPKVKAKRKGMVVGLIITFALLFLLGGAIGLYELLMPTITLTVESMTIRQEDDIPTIRVTTKYSGLKNVYFDEEKSLSTYDLFISLKKGEGYHLSYSVDSSTEGTYPIELVLNGILKEKLDVDWKHKVRCRVKMGNVTVRNKYGDWEGTKFRLLNGTYASGWMNMGEDTYYFDKSGNRVSGVQVIDNNVYCFLEDGRFDNTRNRINPNRPMIALTFDDGPNVHTMRLLEAFEQYDSRATFFMVGTNVPYFKAEIQKMVEIGCELGNHTTHHVRLSQQTESDIRLEIEKTDLWVYDVVGQKPTLIRPPYGQVNELVQETVSAPLVFWSVDTLDWELKDAEKVRDYVLETVRDGDIVLLHDIHKTTVDAMIECIPMLIEEGYQLVTVSEMAKIRGITLEDGEKYYSFRKEP